MSEKKHLNRLASCLASLERGFRQLEKAIIARLKAQAESDLPKIKDVERAFLVELEKLGGVARISTLSAKFHSENNRKDQAHVAFLAELSPNLTVVEENDHFFHSVGITAKHTEKEIKDTVGKIVDSIKGHGKTNRHQKHCRKDQQQART